MKRLLLPLLAAFAIPTVVNGKHLKGLKELIVSSESTKESIALAKYLKDSGVVKYSAYWCPNCLDQIELMANTIAKLITFYSALRKEICVSLWRL